MEAAELLDDVFAGTNVEVVGVREDDLRADSLEIGRRQRADGRLRADRHEDGRRDGPVGQGERARPRGARGCINPEFEHQMIAIASP